MTPSLKGPAKGSRAARAASLTAAAAASVARACGDHRGRPVADPRPPALALEQAKAKLGLELEDLAAERRLAHVAGRRRAAEMAVVGDGDDIFEVSEVHGRLDRSRR